MFITVGKYGVLKGKERTFYEQDFAPFVWNRTRKCVLFHFNIGHFHVSARKSGPSQNEQELHILLCLVRHMPDRVADFVHSTKDEIRS